MFSIQRKDMDIQQNKISESPIFFNSILIVPKTHDSSYEEIL